MLESLASVRRVQPATVVAQPAKYFAHTIAPDDSFLADLRTLEQSAAYVGRDESLFNQGDCADHVYRIIRGTARLCTYSEDGHRQITDFVMQNDILGLLDQDEYACSAEAVTEVWLRFYPRAAIERLLANKPETARHLLAVARQQHQDLRRHVAVVGCQSAKQRVALFLQQMFERTQSTASGCVELPMSQQDIASYLGLTSETVCRTLSEFKRSGLLKHLTLHQYFIADPAKLAAFTQQCALSKVA
jgi:CRP-like cAMP-binding protein